MARTVSRYVRRPAPAVQVLGDGDLPAVTDLLRRRPVADVFVASRVASHGLEPWRLGAEVWGHRVDGRLVALCYVGANVWPVCAGPDSIRAFAAYGRTQPRRCASIVGLAREVLPLWQELLTAWGPAREVRRDQPLMLIEGPPQVAGDPAVRPAQTKELDLILPAAVAMFTEEIGVPPENRDAYRARVGELIGAGRVFVRIENGRVLFKAEVGAATPAACQVQGVWVDPEWRGIGLGTTGTARVVELAQRSIAPVVSLYVNGFNVPARRAYERVGFRQVDTFASVLF